MVWYPILQENRHLELIAEFKNTFNSKIWLDELIPITNNIKGLHGSGIIIVNPPWQLDNLIKEDLQFLKHATK